MLTNANGGMAYACEGFAPPFDQSILLRKDRAIPFKTQLFENGILIDDLNIAGLPPVVNVTFSAGGGSAVDVTDQLEPLGQANDGNQFRFDVATSQWVFTQDELQRFFAAIPSSFSGGGRRSAPKPKDGPTEPGSSIIGTPGWAEHIIHLKGGPLWER